MYSWPRGGVLKLVGILCTLAEPGAAAAAAQQKCVEISP